MALEDAGWRVFISHTSELRDFPRGKSYVAAVELAVSAAGHVIVDMADFPAADRTLAELVVERVRGCDVYVGILGTRYGTPVRDRPEVSYPELEFATATEAGLPRLVFLLDPAEATTIPPTALTDLEFGDRQAAFRQRVRDSGLVTETFSSPDQLERLVEHSLRELAAARWRSPSRVFIAHRSDAEYARGLERALEREGMIVLNSGGAPNIAREISSADVVVADITGASPNVYYELGLAHALRIPTVLIMSDEEITRLPTDLAGTPVIFYDESDLVAATSNVTKAITRIEGRR